MISKNNNLNQQVEQLQRQLEQSKAVAESERIAREKAENNVAILSMQLNEIQDKLIEQELAHQSLRKDANNALLELHETQDLLKRERTKYLQEIYRSEQLNHALMDALDDSNEKNEKEINKLSSQLNQLNEKIQNSPMDGDNSQYEHSRFGLAISLKGSEYNNGNLMKTELDPHEVIDNKEPAITYTITAVKNGQPFLNQTSVKLDLASPNISGDKLQQFQFTEDGNDTVIKLVADEGLAFTVSDPSPNASSGAPFCLSPFNAKQNQEFVFQDNKLYSKQDGKVVTYIGGNVPFVMMDPSDSLEARQTFTLVLF